MLGASAVSAAIERTVERLFPLAHRAKVNVDTPYGSIHITSTDRPEVKIVVRESIDAASEEAANRQLRDLDLAIEQRPDGTVSLRASYKKALRWTWEKWPPVGLEIEMSVPTTSDLDLLSHEGAIEVGNVQGEVKIRAMQGRVFAGEIEGPLTIWSAKGDIAVTACQGELRLTARGGNIIVGRTIGRAGIAARGGVVEVQATHGALQAESEDSDLKVGFAYPLTGDSNLQASGGDILVTFDPRTSATIEARASTLSKVTVHDLPLVMEKGEASSSRLQATLNGGGPRVVIRSSGGGVRLLGVPAMPKP